MKYSSRSRNQRFSSLIWPLQMFGILIPAVLYLILYSGDLYTDHLNTGNIWIPKLLKFKSSSVFKSPLYFSRLATTRSRWTTRSNGCWPLSGTPGLEKSITNLSKPEAGPYHRKCRKINRIIRETSRLSNRFCCESQNWFWTRACWSGFVVPVNKKSFTSKSRSPCSRQTRIHLSWSKEF